MWGVECLVPFCRDYDVRMHRLASEDTLSCYNLLLNYEIVPRSIPTCGIPDLHACSAQHKSPSPISLRNNNHERICVVNLAIPNRSNRRFLHRPLWIVLLLYILPLPSFAMEKWSRFDRSDCCGVPVDMTSTPKYRSFKFRSFNIDRYFAVLAQINGIYSHFVLVLWDNKWTVKPTGTSES